jgi:hypothetical protein
MTTPDPSAALNLLETIRSQRHPDIAEHLLTAIYEREHAEQFEQDRGVIQAALRDLIAEHIEASA